MGDERVEKRLNQAPTAVLIYPRWKGGEELAVGGKNEGCEGRFCSIVREKYAKEWGTKGSEGVKVR